jgi:hypothetical protein
MWATTFTPWEESAKGKSWADHPYVHCQWKSAYRDDYRAVADWVGEHIEPVDFYGGEGDVLFWHSRCFHAASRNFSAATGRPAIRQAMFYDCHRADLSDADYGNTTHDSMWHEWSAAVQAAVATLPPAEGPARSAGGSVEPHDLDFMSGGGRRRESSRGRLNYECL